MPRSRVDMPHRSVWRNFVFMTFHEDMTRAMKEVEGEGLFERVHTPVAEVKVRMGKERKRQLVEEYLLPGYFFGRTKSWEPLSPEFKYSTKLMTTFGWGWCHDEELERMTGVRLDKRRKKSETKLKVGDKAFLLGYAFKGLPTGAVLSMNEGEDLTLESPFFGGVPVRISVGNSMLTKTRL